MIAQLLLIGSLSFAEPPAAKQPAENVPSAHDVYCSQLSVRSTEAEMYRSDPENYNAHWKELSTLQTALLSHIEEEALEKKMTFELYKELMRKRSKEMGKEIKLSEFARAQYVSDLFQRICVPLEAGISPSGAGRENQPTEAYQPFDAKSLPAFTPFKTQPANSTK